MSAPSAAAQVGATIPNTTFAEVPYTPELDDAAACGIPSQGKTHDLFKGKKAVIIAVPGAFTPTCHVKHIPDIVKSAQKYQDKGYVVYVIAQNDPFVLSAWGRTNGAKGEVHFATDVDIAFSKALGATIDMSSKGFGIRTGRYLLVADDLKITHFAAENGPGEVEVSGAKSIDAVL